MSDDTKTIDAKTLAAALRKSASIVLKNERKEANKENQRNQRLLLQGLALVKDCFLYEAVSSGKTIDDAMYQKAMDAATSAADLEAIIFAKENQDQLDALIKKLSSAVERRAKKNAATDIDTKDEANSVGEDGDEGAEDDQSGAPMMGPLTDEDIEFVG